MRPGYDRAYRAPPPQGANRQQRHSGDGGRGGAIPSFRRLQRAVEPVYDGIHDAGATVVASGQGCLEAAG